MMGEIREIRPAQDATRRLLDVLGELGEKISDEGYIAGAFVVWGPRGEVHTVYDTRSGPVSKCLMPTFVHDALNRHVAVAIAQSCTAESLDEDGA